MEDQCAYICDNSQDEKQDSSTTNEKLYISGRDNAMFWLGFYDALKDGGLDKEFILEILLEKMKSTTEIAKAEYKYYGIIKLGEHSDDNNGEADENSIL